MARPEQEPIAEPGSHGGTTYTHPAFGQIGASRVSGASTLYGSDFVHQHYVTIRISHSELHRELSRDWHHARDEIIEVALSEAQWATFVSSMNIGAGVPCTIGHVRRERAPSIPERRQEDEFKAEVYRKAEAAAKQVDAAIAEVEGEIGGALSKVKRDRILARLRTLRQDLGANLPFVARSFEKHMEDTVESAKVEVAAYISNTITRAGLAALTGGSDTGPLRLTSGKATDA